MAPILAFPMSGTQPSAVRSLPPPVQLKEGTQVVLGYDVAGLTDPAE